MQVGEQDDVQFQVKFNGAKPPPNATDGSYRSFYVQVYDGLQVVSGETSQPGPLTDKGVVLSLRVQAMSSGSTGIRGFVDREGLDTLTSCYYKPYETSG